MAQADIAADPRLGRLRVWNLVAGFAHLVQLIAVLALANDFSIPITASYLEGPPGTTPGAPVTLLDVPLAYGVALFFGLSALFQFLVCIPPFYDRYIAGLVQRHNYFRWVEYSISSSVMIVLISQIVGISDAAALMAIFGVNASMIFFGLVQEKYVKPGSGDMVPFILGCMTGIVPWLIIVLYVIGPNNPSTATAPAFVYGIIVSLFIFFNCFAVVQWLQYKKIPMDYLKGEKAYIILSLVAKSALAWQIFSGTLIPS
ncbi:MAG: heliorhodopsin HeR [Candidatus Nanopelagicales bacterium]